MTVTVRYLQRSEQPRVARFLDEFWAPDHIYGRSQPLFDWTFGGRGLWDQEEYSFAIAEQGSEIVGILGAIPYVFNAHGETSRGLWLANWMTRTEHRHGVTGLKLLAQFCRPPYNTVISFGNNANVAPILRALQWHLLDDIPRHFIVLPEAVARLARLIRLTYSDWDTGRARSLAQAFRLTNTPGTAVEPIRYVPSDWDRSWAQIASYTVGAIRDEAYLTWRYLEHPCFQYRLIAVPDGHRTGLAVWRLETIHRSTPSGLEPIDKIGRLVEFLPVSHRNSQDLFALFVQDLYEADAVGADYYGYHGMFGSWLRDSGFAEIEAYPDGKAIPSRFQPLESKGGRTLGAIWTGGNPYDYPHFPLSKDCDWYWTKSDGDQDRPT